MRSSLMERCVAQVRNEELLRKGHWLEHEHIVKLGAMMFANAGLEANAETLKECKRILKGKAGLFSNFRGTMEYLVQVKMALADDPEAYIDGVLHVYEQLKSGRLLPGESIAMAATTIYENCPAEQLDEVVQKTLHAYAMVKEQHRFLTGEDDMALIALMIMAGKDPSRAADEAEELYVMLKDHFFIGSETPQSTAMVLALSDKPAKQKVEDFFGLYEACKATGHATSKDRAMTVYATYADLDDDRDEIVSEIGEVDDWLKKQKGYGAFGVGSSIRRLFAAALVLADHQDDASPTMRGASSAITQSIVEELLLTLISIIITSVIVSSATSSNH